MKATVIINPLAGKKRALEARSVAEKLATELGVEIRVEIITGPGHGTELAREAVRNGQQRVISIGGDGTLNAIASGLIGSEVGLGIVAMGSGNGYARSLKLPLVPEQALRVALTGAPHRMDVCYLNDRPFLGTAGIGFDARVAWEFDRTDARGLWSYARIILKDIIGAKPMRVVVKANNNTHEERVLMLVFCNTREFGNGAVISPGSAPDDGMAELRIVTKPSFVPLIKAFVQIYTGKADRSRFITNVATREATIRQDGTLAHLDGEPVVIGNELRFRLEPKRLHVILPR